MSAPGVRGLPMRPGLEWVERIAAGWRELQAREPALARFGLLLFVLAIPAALALGLDPRELRGVPVWAKPLKFLVSVGVFAWTAAWFAGGLSTAQRRSRLWRATVAVLIATGAGEIAYIAVMAALGQASHYNATSVWHARAYVAMGAGAMALTATQLVLAALLWRGRRALPAAERPGRQAVVVGLVLTFALGAGVGALLSGIQPPAGAGLPPFGWHPSGDLRPAHFLGLHAQQLLPLAAWRWRGRLWLLVALYVLVWSVLVAMGLQGATFSPPRAG